MQFLRPPDKVGPGGDDPICLGGGSDKVNRDLPGGGKTGHKIHMNNHDFLRGFRLRHKIRNGANITKEQKDHPDILLCQTTGKASLILYCGNHWGRSHRIIKSLIHIGSPFEIKKEKEQRQGQQFPAV